MPLIPAAALAQMRREHDLELTDTLEVLRTVETRDSGGVTPGTETVAATYACRLSSVGTALGGSGEARIAERLTLDSAWRAELPANADLTPADRVRVTLSGQAARTFDVKYATGRRSLEIGSWALLEEVSS